MPRLVGYRLDPDVATWEAAVVAAGDTVAGYQRSAVQFLASALKAQGLWESCLMIDTCTGTTITAATTRLKVPNGVSASYGVVNFGVGNYTPAAGITGDGSSMYLNTGINALSLGYSTSSLMLWAYTRTTASAGTTRASIGAGATVGTLLGWVNIGSEEAVAIARASTSTELAGRVATSTTGFLGGGTNGSRVATFYKNGVATGTTATETGSAFNNATFFVHASNNSTTGTATPGQYNNRTLASCYITTGLSAAQVATFYTIVQAYETALGRNV